MGTEVVNVEDHQATDRDVYIGRPSKWGNPFVIGEDGTRSEVIEKYRAYVLDTELKFELEELRDKVLVCFCKPEACHGDVLVELLEQTTLEEFFQ